MTTTATPVKIGDIRKVKLRPRVSPRYLDGALVEVVKARRIVWGGAYASTPYTEWECKIVQMEKTRRDGRFQVGVTCFIDERYLL